ncbi:MAG: hypothetical protein ACI9QQ_001109 [Myxococcota bacterium]
MVCIVASILRRMSLDPPAAATHSSSHSIAHVAAALAVGVGALFFVVPLASRCLTMADEGYLLLQALDMANGKLLYRDMDAFVTPGMWFLLAAVFKMTEPSVWASRIPVIIGYVALIALSYRIPRQISGPRAGLVSIVLMMICTVWAFPAWTFAFYSPFSVLFALAGLERLLAYRVSWRRRDIILAGLLFGLSVAFKQNYGTFALIGACLSLIALRRETGQSLMLAVRSAGVDGLWLAVGVAAIALPIVAYFGAHGALADVFMSLVVHPFEFSGMHDIPYLEFGALFQPDVMSETLDIMTYGAQSIYRTPMPTGFVQSIRLIERLHVLLYWLPPLIAIMGATLAFGAGARDDRDGGGTKDAAAINETPSLHGGLLSVLLVCFAVFLGTFPRADFNHLINVYQPVVIAGVSTFAVFFAQPSTGFVVARKLVGVSVASVLCAYLLVSVYWYYALVLTLSIEVEGSRGGVKISPPEMSSLRQILRNIDQVSEPGEALLTVPDIAMLNFLSKRPMPSAYYNLYEHHIAHDGGAAVADGAKAMGATVAVTRLNNFFSDRVGLRDYAPVLTNYIDTHFEQRYSIGRAEYLLYTLRDEPVAAADFMSILDACKLQPNKAIVKEHLLFRTLYQTFGTGVGQREEAVVAKCLVDIPEAGGDLVWQLDYAKPSKLLSPATIRVEIHAALDGVTERVFVETIEVKTINPRVSRIPAAREYRVDLSRYAGKSIALVVRSVRSGNVVMSANALSGFGTRWQHPRIVLPKTGR